MVNTLRVAAVQMDCRPAEVAHNLKHASSLIANAADKGSELVLLPELLPTGFMLSEEIWDYAETIDGSSVNWLLNTASHFKIYLGFTFLEGDGEDFYNTFVLANPEGKLVGRVRKSPAASVEAYFYRAGSDRHVIETDLGRIGVGICYENLLYDQMVLLYNENIDLLLSPFAAGRAKPFIPGDIKRFDDMIRNSRAILTKTLGAPLVMADRVGKLETELPGWLPYLKSSFAGLSSIVDYDGTIKAELGDEEGVIVADIQTGKRARQENEPRRYGKMWGIPVPWYAFIWPMSQRWGEKSYADNARRKQKALSISGGVEHLAPQ